MAGLLIGDVAQRATVSAPTIRYYESLGLLQAPRRSTAGYRRYSDTTVEELRFIKKAQGLGFSLGEVGEILKLSRSGQRPCARSWRRARLRRDHAVCRARDAGRRHRGHRGGIGATVLPWAMGLTLSAGGGRGLAAATLTVTLGMCVALYANRVSVPSDGRTRPPTT